MANAENNPLEFKTKQSNIIIGDKTLHKQMNKIKIITNFYDARDEAIKFFRGYSGYYTTHGVGLKILTLKQIFQRLPIALVYFKAGNTPNT